MRQIKTFRSKKEFAYDALRTAILEGDLKPGARLVIDELATELGVSQIPVREALQQLQANGFVTIEPYVGAKVTEIDAGLVCEIFNLLESLEVISGRAACQQMTEEGLDEMEGLLRGMDALVDNPDSFSQENARLHQFICDQAGMPLVRWMRRRRAFRDGSRPARLTWIWAAGSSARTWWPRGTTRPSGITCVACWRGSRRPGSNEGPPHRRAGHPRGTASRSGPLRRTLQQPVSAAGLTSPNAKHRFQSRRQHPHTFYVLWITPHRSCKRSQNPLTNASQCGKMIIASVHKTILARKNHAAPP